MDLKFTMLITDPNEQSRKVLFDTFCNDYNIIESNNLDKTIEIIKKTTNIDVLLIDLTNTSSRGIDFLHALTENENLIHFTIAVITGPNDKEIENEALKLGIEGFIEKPYNTQVVKVRIQNLVDKRRLQLALVTDNINEQISLIMDQIPSGIVIFEVTQKIRILYCNDILASIFGYNKNEFMKRFASDASLVIHYEDKAAFLDFLNSASRKDVGNLITSRVNLINGSIGWISCSISKLSRYDGKLVIYGVVSDITKEKANSKKLEVAVKELRFRVEHDMLTGLYNNETFLKELPDFIKKNVEEKYLLVRIDVEKFKFINEVYGVGTGDQVLSDIASIIDGRKYEDAIYARVAGDHFAICIPERLFNIENEIIIYDQIIKEKYPEHNIIISFGIYQIDDIELSADQICSRALLALNSVKGNYIKRYGYYDDSVRQKMLEEQNITSEMEQALKNGEFIFYLQPLFDSINETIVSAEALVRWISKTRGFVSPGTFIPLFEKNRFIIKLDAYIREEVCKYLRNSIDQGKMVVPISVNISRVELYNTNLAQDIVQLVKKYNLDPKLLKIEITETVFTENPTILFQFITTLQSHGFQVLMDDFGSGYSSLNMLKSVPVDILKIDLKFLEDFDINPKSGSILISVVKMARWLQLGVVAEGVETKEHANFLKEIGCDMAQGYYFARPMKVADFEIEIIKRNANLPESKPKDSFGVDINQILNNNYLSTETLEALNLGLAIYEFTNDKFELFRINQTFYRIFNGMVNPLLPIYYSDKEEKLASEQKDILSKTKKAIKTRKAQNYLYAASNKHGELTWYNINIEMISGNKDKAVICMIVNDTNIKNEIDNSEYYQKYYRALSYCYDFLYEVNLDDNIIKDIMPSSKKYQKKYAYDQWQSYIDLIPDLNERLKYCNFMTSLSLDRTCNEQNPVLNFTVKMFNDEDNLSEILITFIFIDQGRYFLGINQQISIDDNNNINSSLQLDSGENSRYLLDKMHVNIFEWNFDTQQFNTSDERNEYNFNDIPVVTLDGWKKQIKIRCVHPSDYERFDQFFQNNNDRTRKNEIEIRLKKDDNKYHWCYIVNELVRNIQGHIVKIISLVYDIENEMNAKLNLKSTIQMFDNIMLSNSLGLGILEITDPIRPIYINSEVYQILDYNNNVEMDVMMVSQEIVNALTKSKNGRINYTFQVGGVFEETIRLSRKDASEINCIMKAFVQIGNDQKKYCYYSIVPQKSGSMATIGDSGNALIYQTLMEATDTLIFVYNTVRKTIKYSLLLENGSRQDKEFDNGLDYILEGKFIHSSHRNSIIASLVEASYENKSETIEFLADFYENGFRWYRVNYRSISDDNKRIYQVVGRVTDIQNEKEAVKRLAVDEKYHATLLTNTIYICEHNLMSNHINVVKENKDKTLTLYPYNLYFDNEYDNRLIHPDERKYIHERYSAKALIEIYNQGNTDINDQFRVLSIYGEWVWLQLSAYIVQDSLSKDIIAYIYIRYIDEEVKHSQLLKNRAEHDYISGLYNRATLEDIVRKSLANAEDNQKYYFIYLDVDNFKQINDSYGHPTGDEIIRRVSNAIKEAFNEGEVIGRMSGDEFSIFFEQKDAPDELTQKIQKMTHGINDIYNQTELLEPVTVSIGISSAHGKDNTFEKIFEEADKALYYAKLKGKNCAFYYDSIDDETKK